MQKKTELAQQPKDTLSSKSKANAIFVSKALDILTPILKQFNSNQIDKIYDIERINPSRFAGISMEAARTILALRQGNPSLPLDYIFKVVDTLAHRARPWESLRALSAFGQHCCSQSNMTNISRLMAIDSGEFETMGNLIKGRINELENTRNKKFIKFFSLSDQTSTQYDEDIMQKMQERSKDIEQRSDISYQYHTNNFK